MKCERCGKTFNTVSRGEEKRLEEFQRVHNSTQCDNCQKKTNKDFNYNIVKSVIRKTSPIYGALVDKIDGFKEIL